MNKSKLIGCFSSPDDYKNTCESIRDNYKMILVDDSIKVFKVSSKYDVFCDEFLYLFNLGTSSYFPYFRKNDIVLNKFNKTIFTINGLNLLLESKGMQRGDKFDFEPYKNTIITSLANNYYIKDIKYICKG
jgi:hypothetical protein